MSKDILVCADCGTTKNVKETICPYAKEINDVEIEVTLCEKCYQERLWEI